MMMFYMGVEQSSEQILSEQKSRTADNIPALREMLRMVDAAEAVLAGGRDISEFGLLLHEAWELKKGLARGISNGCIDDAYAAARRAGARPRER